MKTVLVVVFFFHSFYCFTQERFDSTKVSSGLMKVVRNIVSCKCVGNEGSGLSGRHHITPSIREEFYKGTSQEFLELLNHPSKEVRYLAFGEVAGKIDTFNFMPSILNSFSKNEQINTTGGDIVNGINFSDYLINLFLRKMTVEQRMFMDSILIFNTIDVYYSDRKKENKLGLDISLSGPIEYREKLLYELKPEEKYYSRLKTIYNLEASPMVVYTILKYAKPEDSTILCNGIVSHQNEYLFGKSQAFWCYRTIFEHPINTRFSSLAMAYDDVKANYLWQDCYERYMYILALTKYKSSKSLEIMLKMLQDDKNLPYMKNGNLLWMALAETKDDFFNPISKMIVINPEDQKWMEAFITGFETVINQ